MIFFIILRIRAHLLAQRTIPTGLTTRTKDIGCGIEHTRATLCANPVMVTVAGGLHPALLTTENAASSAGTFCVRGIQLVMFGTKPFVSTDGTAVFDRAVLIAVGTHPSVWFADFAESRCLSSANGKATAAPSVMRRTYCVRTVRLVALRTFPAVYARGTRIINAFAVCSTAPTVMIRAGFSLQMPDFAPGLGVVDVTVAGMLAEFFFRRIIHCPTVDIFAVPITLRARFR